MAAIWMHNGGTWQLLAASGFPREQELHDLVASTPHLLPLAGAPQLVVLGKEVPLGAGYADVLAVETTGRPVIIEVKLAANAESRRAVVAQILAYAAHLHGQDPATLEQTALAGSLALLGHSTIAGAVAAADQQGEFDAPSFSAALGEHLREGRVRLVLVLDRAPPELVRLVGYLQTVTDRLSIDLVTVVSYDVGGTRVVVPQRVEPAPPDVIAPASSPGTTPGPPKVHGQLSQGAEAFQMAIETAPSSHQPLLRRLTDWALTLEQGGFAQLATFQSATGRCVTLLPRLLDERVGLVTIWNDARSIDPAYISLWRSVFARRAPAALSEIEDLLATAVGQGTVVHEVTPELLSCLTAAYREARTPPTPGTPGGRPDSPGAEAPG